jgi:hypothetical protein
VCCVVLTANVWRIWQKDGWAAHCNTVKHKIAELMAKKMLERVGEQQESDIFASTASRERRAEAKAAQGGSPASAPSAGTLGASSAAAGNVEEAEQSLAQVGEGLAAGFEPAQVGEGPGAGFEPPGLVVDAMGVPLPVRRQLPLSLPASF